MQGKDRSMGSHRGAVGTARVSRVPRGNVKGGVARNQVMKDRLCPAKDFSFMLLIK